jgi:hypothetical protein
MYGPGGRRAGDQGSEPREGFGQIRSDVARHRLPMSSSPATSIHRDQESTRAVSRSNAIARNLGASILLVDIIGIAVHDLVTPIDNPVVELGIGHAVRWVEPVPIDDLAKVLLPALVGRFCRRPKHMMSSTASSSGMPSSGFIAAWAFAWPIAVTHQTL